MEGKSVMKINTLRSFNQMFNTDSGVPEVASNTIIQEKAQITLM